MKFTDRKIHALKPKPDRYEVWEEGRKGFGLRLSPKGNKSWIYLYRIDGRARRMTFGSYPAMGLATAHRAHGEAEARLEAGIDPGAERVSERKAERTAETVKELADEYIEKWAKPRKKSHAEDRRILDKDVIPVIGHKKAKDVTRRDIIALLDRVVDRGASVQANRVLAVVRRMFNFSVERSILDTTPVVKIRPPGKETQRDRVLTLHLRDGDDTVIGEAAREDMLLLLRAAGIEL